MGVRKSIIRNVFIFSYIFAYNYQKDKLFEYLDFNQSSMNSVDSRYTDFHYVLSVSY